MPWTIWPALVVLWGVCWIFYAPWDDNWNNFLPDFSVGLREDAGKPLTTSNVITNTNESNNIAWNLTETLDVEPTYPTLLTEPDAPNFGLRPQYLTAPAVGPDMGPAFSATVTTGLTPILSSAAALEVTSTQLPSTKGTAALGPNASASPPYQPRAAGLTNHQLVSNEEMRTCDHAGCESVAFQSRSEWQ